MAVATVRSDANDSPKKNRRQSRNNAFLATVFVLKSLLKSHLLNRKPEYNKTLDAATFRVSNWNTWAVYTIPAPHRRASRSVGVHRISIIQNLTPLWNIIVKDLDPTKYWNTALVRQVEGLQLKMPSTPCVVLTTSMNFYRYKDTLKRWKKLGIQVRLLEHPPSDPKYVDEMTKILGELFTLETIDPHHTLGKKSLEEWLSSKDSGQSSAK